MSRFLPLVVFVLWLTASPAPSVGVSPVGGLAILLGGYALLIAAMYLWSRHVASQVHEGDAHRRMWRLNWIMFFARLLVPAWLGVGIYLLGWKFLVETWLDLTPLKNWPIDSPGLILGTLPAMAAWMGLLWSQVPADRALWEQNLLIELDQNLPIHTAGGFWSYFNVNVRLKILFAAVPALVLFVLRDSLMLATMNSTWLHAHPGIWDAITSVPPFLIILVAGSEILRRILITEPMPPSPLRDRLEEICRRNRIGIRDVLLWHTRHQMGNAAVIGLVPQVRYILMSDLLVETLSDEQIEAVFAHEMGHVRHRHLFWLVAVIYGMLIAIDGPGQWLGNQLAIALHHIWIPETGQTVVLTLLALGAFTGVFGIVSRRFERQADVFAARTIQANAPRLAMAAEFSMTDPMNYAALAPEPQANPEITSVGRYGAHTVAGALHRVAAINNIPITARSWSHGSISERMRFLMDMGTDATATARLDRSMRRLYWVLFLGLIILSIWLIYGLLAGHGAAADFM
jgi:STE24 endopeptidase